ncbi:MAG: hypothetical protein BM557_09500 [Flavobacterium sp. MedPE-SWcel]|nr:MAG: hypothetical protein BM557_09500 [Flavobacterium sp. MedPE-SWcel]
MSFYWLHKGGILIKLWSTVKLAIVAVIPTFVIINITGWTISNRDYVAGVLICIAVDHIVGSIYHAFRVKDFTFKKNAIGLLTKLSLCVVAAILFEVIYLVVKEASLIYDYLKMVTRLIVVLYPAGSAFMNISALTNGRFPPLGWISKLNAFNKDLDLNNFRDKQPDTQENIIE